MTYDLIIIGSGHAGCSTAREFRRLDADAGILILTADDGRIYSKPMLSTALARKQDPDSLAMQDAETFAKSVNATILTNTETLFINPDEHMIDTTEGQFSYGSLVLAIGASPRRLSFQGDAADTVFKVNNLMDYSRYRESLASAKHVTVIGAGLVGSEFANDLASSGFEVAQLDPMPWPLHAFVPQPVGDRLANSLRGIGVELKLGFSAKAIDHATGGGYRVRLDDDSHVQTDLVVSAVGLVPHIELAQDAGLDTDRAIKVNRRLETSAPDIYALGDCAAVNGLNLPFIMPIMHAARTLAAVLKGEPDILTYPAMPITVKTPCMPIVVSPPPSDTDGDWQMEDTESGMRGKFLDEGGNLQGFVVTNALIGENRTLAADVPPWLS